MLRPLLLALAAALAIDCGSPSATREPQPAAWTAPPGWVTVSSGTAIQLTIPPWLVVWDTANAIFANEAPPAPDADVPMNLAAFPPRGIEQPAVGQDLGAWIDSRLRVPGQGVPAVTRVVLPAGSATRYDRTDREGTPTAWRVVAYAIEAPAGVAFLELAGPQDAWTDREADLDRIPFLVRIGP